MRHNEPLHEFFQQYTKYYAGFDKQRRTQYLQLRDWNTYISANTTPSPVDKRVASLVRVISKQKPTKQKQD